ARGKPDHPQSATSYARASSSSPPATRTLTIWMTCARTRRSNWPAGACRRPARRRGSNEGDLQVNRVKRSRGDEAREKVVIPCGDLAPAAQGVLAGNLSEQVMGYVFNGGEIGRGVIGPDAALVIAEDHVHDPVQAVLNRPVAAHDRSEESRRHDQ